MKSPLFWKIVISFWLTYVIVTQGGWIVYMLYSDEESYQFRIAERMAPVQLGAARVAIETGGEHAYERLIESWPERRRDDLQLTRLRNGCIEGEGDFCDDIAEFVTAVDPEGEEWQVKYELPSAVVEWSVMDALDLPDDLLAMSAIGAVLFSAALAVYLTRPVRKMRRGFETLAAGDLTIRLAPTIGRRRDEIADLARDFDRMAERLQQLVQVRDQLLHDVSHELRSPLARLNQSIALLRQNPGEIDSSLLRIEREVRRLDELVGELLSLARAESGESSRDQYFDLPALIQSIIANAAFEASAKNVVVDARSLENMEGIVRGNVELMRRAVENVIRNALQVSRPGQAIEIGMSTDAVRHIYIVTIADRGPGVAASRLETMFEPFVRLKEGYSGKGYGLGLAIARRAILALGGSIDARNRVEGGLMIAMSVPVHAIGAVTPG